jgi:hypothetical protein
MTDAGDSRRHGAPLGRVICERVRLALTAAWS